MLMGRPGKPQPLEHLRERLKQAAQQLVEKNGGKRGGATRVAAMFEISQAAVSQWVGGKNIPEARNALKLMDLVGDVEGRRLVEEALGLRGSQASGWRRKRANNGPEGEQ